MIEEVKKILDSLDPNSPISFGRITGEICQLIKQARQEMVEEIEKLFADNTGVVTFIRQKDGRAGVEECKLLIASEWQELKGEEI